MDYLNILKAQWIDLTESANNYSSEIFDKIVACYTDAKRYYHNISHIGNMIEFAHEYSDQILNKTAFYFAIFYHDLIYDTSRNDNEIRSAEHASSDLQKLCFDNCIIHNTTGFILATKYHNVHPSSDINMLIDMDLAILGSPKEQYEMYMINIRKEYSLYNDLQYRKGRIDILKHFLRMEFIYKTTSFRLCFEERAKRNINFELTTLL